jgi:hypothetical protein
LTTYLSNCISPRANGKDKGGKQRTETRRQGDKERRALRTYIVIAILDQESDTLALQGFSISTGIVGESLFGSCDIL